MKNKEVRKPMSIQENVNKVEVYYNGNEKAFDQFLESAVKGYMTTDSTLPNEEPEDEEISEDDGGFSLAI